MRRLSLPASVRRRVSVSARVAGVAGAVLVLIATLGACSSQDAGSVSEVTTSGHFKSAPMPPPPTILAQTVASEPVGEASAPAAAAAAASASSLASVQEQLDATLVEASRCTTDAECRTVATGGKACGGPTAYRAYSSRRAEPADVEALAAKERDLGMAQARASGRVSACFMLADPGARCESHRCVTGRSAP